MELAKSIWPRSGGDAGNTARSDRAGPSRGEVAWRVELPPRALVRHARRGVVVGEDGLLRAVANGWLVGVELGVGIRWATRIDDPDCCSLPTALADGTTVLGTSRGMALHGCSGELLRFIPSELPLDDSGSSPAVTRGGALLATCPTGELLRLEGEAWVAVGDYGYDLVPPALFADDTLAVAGYAGAGYCRVRLDGQRVWRTELKDADLLPVVSSRQDSAAGSVNDEVTHFYREDGARLGVYPRAAIVSEHPSGWAALSDGELALLDPGGAPLWTRPLAFERRGWGVQQAIVDGAGNLYAPTARGVVSFAADGRERFATELEGARGSALALVEEGAFALFAGDALLILR